LRVEGYSAQKDSTKPETWVHEPGGVGGTTRKKKPVKHYSSGRREAGKKRGKGEP